MRKNKFKKAIPLLVIILLMIVMVSACGRNVNKLSSVGAKTQFASYSQSVCAGECAFELLFFCTAEDLQRWKKENIEDMWIKIGENQTDVSIINLNVSENPIYERYYVGYLTIYGSFKESSGKMALNVQTKYDSEIREYDLGVCSVIDTRFSENVDIVEMMCGGVVKEDEDENVCTYGIIVHINVAEDIYINEIHLGLDNVGLDTENYLIFTPVEYKNSVYKNIDEVTFDKYYENAYVKKYVTDIDAVADIKLEKGEYYMYFPVEYIENTPVICQGVVNIEYTTSDGTRNNFISNCFPYFTEFGKSEESLKMMFEE